MTMKVGEYKIKAGDMALNAGRCVQTIAVINTGDRPIQIGSHYHFYEVNAALSFDRESTLGYRLNILSGTAVRFEPGQAREVELVAISGRQHIYGFAGKVMGVVDPKTSQNTSKKRIDRRIYAEHFGPTTGDKVRLADTDLWLEVEYDLTSHIERIQKHTIRLRSAVQTAIDLHFSAIANQTNENMRILAIITAIFAPLTLLTGVYGMNFEFIPGLKSPTGFWIMLGIMLMTTLILLYYFYRRHLVGRGEKSVIDMLAQQHADQHMNLFWFIDYEPIKQTVKGTIKDLEKITKLK